MCLARAVTAEIQTQARQDIDMVFAIANTASMADEQTALAAQLPRLITILSTGDLNADDVVDFPPAQSLRLAVVSSDLGLPSVDGIEGCAGLGDDGLFQNTGDGTAGVCSPTYDPPFLTFSAERGDDPAAVASDLACIAALGTGGCTIQQPLESLLKATWPAADMNVTFVTDPSGFGMFGQAGPGAPNGDFFREDSLISLVVVTDEEDCSTRNPDFFAPDASMNGIDTRCYYEGLRGMDSNLFYVERYIQLFKMLRAGNERNAFFTVIAGVPAELTMPDILESYDITVPGEAEAYADMLLAAPEMQQQIDDRGTPMALDDDGMVPSCNRGEDAKAYPPRRLVEVARGFGANGVIDSICRDDFTQPINRMLDRIISQLGVPCLARPLVRNSEGNVDCQVLWELPRNASDGPTSCDDLPFLSALRYPAANGGALCEVDQLVVRDDRVDGDDGWYYDDFSETAQQACVGAVKQRIAFSDTAAPPPGVTVKLSCFDASYHVELPNQDELDSPPDGQAEIGSPCGEVIRNHEVLDGDSACELRLRNGDIDESLFCHDEHKYCVLGCEEDDDCPELWHCDDSAATVSAAGGAFCSPGTCSAGPGSANADVVGDPCLPYAIPENGFDDATVYVEGNQADCGGGACIVFHLDGDPRQSCPSRGGCTPRGGVCSDDVLRCADALELERRVYCSCRCDAPEGFAECECPNGFSCVETLGNAPAEIAGSYCVRNETVATN
jgi:hypothetical protein